jgi:formylglycine-generating enzyme required for sulfatase activity
MSQCSIKGLAKGLVRVSAVFSVLLFFGCGGGGGDDDNNGKNGNGNGNGNGPVLGGSGSDGETKTIKGIECVMVKAGTFMMGTTDAEEGSNYDERPRHQVTLTKDYWVSKYPVTQKQYRDAIGTNPSDADYGIGDNYPVNTVSWDEAVAFCNKVGGRLLTEAEWEFAARGGNKSNGYIYSGSNTIGDVAWYSDNSGGSTFHPVGQKLPNELGIYDMSGNVWEWVSDGFGDYPSGAVTNPTGPASGISFRVYRGGSWGNGAWFCRVAIRHSISPSIRSGDLGLRVAFNSN